MGSEGMACNQGVFHTMLDTTVKQGNYAKALGVLDDMRATGIVPEVSLYNLLIHACTKAHRLRIAVDVYNRYVVVVNICKNFSCCGSTSKLACSSLKNAVTSFPVV